MTKNTSQSSLPLRLCVEPLNLLSTSPAGTALQEAQAVWLVSVVLSSSSAPWVNFPSKFFEVRLVSPLRG